MKPDDRQPGGAGAPLSRPMILLLGTVLFLGGVPAGFLLALAWALPVLIRPWPPAPWDKAVFMVAGALGLVFTFWSIRTQWLVGKGTPAPFAPPDRLIVSGPYRLCRSPLVFGTVCLNLALGTLAAGLAPGALLACCVAMGLWIYHRRVEEKGLKKRFGREYEKYREDMPFMLPLGPGQK